MNLLGRLLAAATVFKALGPGTPPVSAAGVRKALFAGVRPPAGHDHLGSCEVNTWQQVAYSI